MTESDVRGAFIKRGLSAGSLGIVDQNADAAVESWIRRRCMSPVLHDAETVQQCAL